MPYTNLLNLSPATVVAVLMDDYSKGNATYSITEILRPPQMGALTRRYAGVIVEDVADRMFALYGQIGHEILERAGKAPREVWRRVYEAAGLPWTDKIPLPLAVEERFTFNVGTVTVTGKPDSLLLWPDLSEDGHVGLLLEDYKFTSVWQVVHGPSAEWVAQLNLYALGLRQTDERGPSELRVQAHLRDWLVSRATYNATYPQKQVAIVPIPLWEPAEAQRFLEERVRLHVTADADLASFGPNMLAQCTSEERWSAQPKWAVMRDGKTRAVRVFDNEVAAVAFTVGNASLHVEHRLGLPRRCQMYCPVGKAGLCPQWEAAKIELKSTLDNEERSSVE